MNREEFIADIEESYRKGVELIRIKNKDYGADSDPFKNFRSSEVIGLSVAEAILVRTLDKLSRAGNGIKRELAVKDETLEDTLLDGINYLAILLAYVHAKKAEEKLKV